MTTAPKRVPKSQPMARVSASSMRYPTRVLSGIQPTQSLHLGHYFGAIRHQISLHHEYPFRTYCLIADYHALVRRLPPEHIREGVVTVATSYLAFGLDPSKAVLFRQSDVPAVCELAWILSTLTTFASAARIPTFRTKETTQQTAGLFAYPILQAADILAMRATIVPTGGDQAAHIELAAELAERFNRFVDRDIFPRPHVRLSPSPVVPGVDGKKMHSPSDNTIALFRRTNYLRTRVNAIKTTPVGKGEPLDPDTCTVFKLLALICDDKTIADYRQEYITGKIGYRDAKDKLLLKLIDYFAPYEERYDEWSTRPDDVLDILSEGFRVAKREAGAVLEIVREAIGLRGVSRLTGNR